MLLPYRLSDIQRPLTEVNVAPLVASTSPLRMPVGTSRRTRVRSVAELSKELCSSLQPVAPRRALASALANRTDRIGRHPAITTLTANGAHDIADLCLGPRLLVIVLSHSST